MECDTVGERFGERAVGQPLVALVAVRARLHRLEQLGRRHPRHGGDAQRAVPIGIDLVAEQPSGEFGHRPTEPGLGTDGDGERRTVCLANERVDRSLAMPFATATERSSSADRPSSGHRLEDGVPAAFEPADRRALPGREDHDRRVGQPGNHDVAEPPVERTHHLVRVEDDDARGRGRAPARSPSRRRSGTAGDRARRSRRMP